MKIDLSAFGAKGNVCIMECAKTRDKYKGFTLQKRYLYGADAQGSFVCPRIRDMGVRPDCTADARLTAAIEELTNPETAQAETRGRAFVNNSAKLLLWRLHPERGWIQVWTDDATAMAISWFIDVVSGGDTVGVKRWDKWPQNELARVQKHSLTRLFC